MKTIKMLIFNSVTVVSILSFAPSTWAQTIWTNSQNVSLTVADLIVQSDGESAAYSGTVNFNIMVTPYVTPVYGFVSGKISATLSSQNINGNPVGVPVVYFGQGGTVGGDFGGYVPFVSGISISSPDTFYPGTYSDTEADYADAAPVNGSINVGYGGGGLTFSGNQTPAIVLASGGNDGVINVDNTVAQDDAVGRYNGVFANQNYWSFSNFLISEGQGGGELGTVTLTIPVTMARDWFDVFPQLDNELSQGTKTITLNYVRANAVTNLTPTITVSAGSSSLNLGGNKTLTVSVKNNSQAVGIGPFSINLSSSSLQTVLSSSTTLLQNLTVGPGQTLTTNFTLTGNNPGIVTPQLTVAGNWGWPVAALGLTFSVPGDLNGNITVLAPIAVQTSPPGRSFTVDGTTYTSAQSFDWVPGVMHTISTTQTQSGGTATQYVFNNWSDEGAISHTVSPTSSATYTANFTTQYYLTMNAGSGGSVGQNSQWLNSGQVFSISASPYTGHNFNNWTGSGSGSYSGISSSASITMNGPITETAYFSQQTGTISVVANPPNGGSVIGDGTFQVGSQQQISATPYYGWSFTGWSDGNSQNPRTITVGQGTTTYTADFATNSPTTVSVEVQANPAGATFNVDGTNFSSAQIFNWISGSQHAIGCTETQSGGTGIQYIWTSWSDNGAISHTVTPAVSTTYTVNFTMQYYLTTSYGIGGNSANPSSGWFNNVASVDLSATAAKGYNFSSWTGSGSGSYTGSSPSPTITMNGPITETANFVTTNGVSSGPEITNVVISGSADDYTISIDGSDFGNMAGLPITNVTQNLSIVDFPKIGLGAESGYSGDSLTLIYQSWSDNQIEIGNFQGAPGDAITIAIWNPTTGAGATWGGNVPGGSGTPHISSVIVIGGGTNIQIRISGSGFGNAPTNLPFTGDLNQLIFQDHFSHAPGTGSFEAGGNRWGHGTPDTVTLNYQSWSDRQIIINGFAGAYGQGSNNTLRNGDPVTIVIWNTSDTSQTGPQTAWGGTLVELPSLTIPSPMVSSNGFNLVVSGTLGSYEVQASGDLLTWTSIGMVTNTNGQVTFTDSSAGAYSQRFYRVIYLGQ